jgi:hypothetical protein
MGDGGLVHNARRAAQRADYVCPPDAKSNVLPMSKRKGK